MSKNNLSQADAHLATIDWTLCARIFFESKLREERVVAKVHADLGQSDGFLGEKIRDLSDF